MKKSLFEIKETSESDDFRTITSEWNKISGVKKVIFSKKNTKLNIIKQKIQRIKKQITSEDILKSLQVFNEIQTSGNSKLFDLEKKFLTLDNFLFINYDEFNEINYNNRYKYINLNSESLCLDCLSKDILKYNRSNKTKKSKFNKPKLNSKIPDNNNFNDKYFQLVSEQVGDYNWKLQRTTELLSQVYLEYLQNKDEFSFENLDEFYLDNVFQSAKLFLKFIEYKDSKIHISKIKPYYFISERPFKLFPVLRKFLEETYPEGNFVLSWIKSGVFRKQFITFLKNNKYYGDLKDIRFSRKEYRKIAKKTNRLYFGNIINTSEFKEFVKQKDKPIEPKQNQDSEFNLEGFSTLEIKELLCQQQYDEMYGTTTAKSLYLKIKRSKNKRKIHNKIKNREKEIIRYNWNKIVKGGVDTKVFSPCHYSWEGKII